MMRGFLKTIGFDTKQNISTLNKDENDESQGDQDYEVTIEGNESQVSTGKSIEHSKYINSKNMHGKAALHKAVMHKSAFVKILSTTLQTNLNVTDDRGNTALHFAVQEPQDTISRTLIEAGASRENKNKIGETPLHLAVAADSLANVALLITNKVSLNVGTNNVANMSSSLIGDRSALHYAFFEKKKELNKKIITALIQAGADVNKQDQYGQSVLYYAFKHKLIESLGQEFLQKLILACDVSITNSKNATLLHVIVKNKALSIESFKQVVQHFSKDAKFNDLLNTIDKDGCSAFLYAVRSNDDAKIRVLLGNEPALNNCIHSSPLHEAIKNNNTTLAIELMKRGADVNKRDSANNSPLILAVERGNVEVIEQLSKHQALFSGKDGELAIKKAILKNYVDVAITLIQCGANPDVHIKPINNKWSDMKFTMGSSMLSGDGEDRTGWITDGDTPLHFAIMTNNILLAKTCVESKPSMINSINSKGHTPAYLAIKVLSPEMAYILGGSIYQIQASQQYPGITNKEIFWEARQSTLLMQAISRGFESFEQLDNFFFDKKYQLTDDQIAIKKEVQERYQQKFGNTEIAISKVGFIGKKKHMEIPPPLKVEEPEKKLNDDRMADTEIKRIDHEEAQASVSSLRTAF